MFQRRYPPESRGMRLPGGHMARIPHEAVKRQQPTGRRTPLYIRVEDFTMLRLTNRNKTF